MKKNVTIVTALVVVAIVLAALGGGWKWGGKAGQAHQPMMLAGWAWGDDGAAYVDLSVPAATPTSPDSPE